MRFSTASALAGLFAISSAQFSPSGSTPSGNPIGHPEAGELMPAGSPFTITWTPTTSDNVSLILLQGPSTNVLPILTIVASTPNTGSYTFNVPANLAPAASGYGIELIDSDGTFQYSPQCGVSNAAFSGSSVTVSGSASATAAASASGDSFSTVTLSTGANYTGPIIAGSTSYAIAPTGNTSIPVLSPTGSMTVPVTLQSTVVVTPTAGSTYFSATPSVAQPTHTGAAAVVVGRNAALGFAGLAGLVAAWVL